MTTDIFQMLADTTRQRALTLLNHEGELCICEFVHALDVSQPKISRHMAALRDAGLVTSRRYAQWVFYAINPDLADWKNAVLTAMFKGISDRPESRQDINRLSRMHNRPDRGLAA